MPRILIVDDDKIKAGLYEDITDGFDVIKATSYQSAQLFLPEKFDHVLCDENLGDGSGHKFIQEYSALHPTTDIFWYSAFPTKTLSNGFQCHDVLMVADKLKSIKLKYKKEPEKPAKKCGHHEEVLLEIKEIKETVCAHDRVICEHSKVLEKLNSVADKNVVYAKWVLRAIFGVFIGLIGYFSWLITYLDTAQTKSLDTLQKTITAHIYAAPKN